MLGDIAGAEMRPLSRVTAAYRGADTEGGAPEARRILQVKTAWDGREWSDGTRQIGPAHLSRASSLLGAAI